MAQVWCEYATEFAYFDSSEFEVIGGVRIHKREPWHTVRGEVIEMESDDTPELEDGNLVFDLDSPDMADAADDDWTDREGGDLHG